MKHIMKRSLRVSAVALLALGGLAATPTVSEAAPTQRCYSEGCHGLDPMTMHCNDDATSVATVDVANTTVHLMWSQRCDANWAFAATTPDLITIGVAGYEAGSEPVEDEYQPNNLGTQYIYTNMINGDLPAKACGVSNAMDRCTRRV